MATFVYDGDGQRVKTTIGGTTIAYVGNSYEWTGSTSTAKKYYYAGSLRIAVRTGSSTLNFLLGDHLGSTSLTVNNTGSTLVAELRYKPWGENRYTSGSTPTTFHYTGQREDTGLGGLYFYNARWYEPGVGRFVQADTLVPEPGNTQAFNRYSYVYNNPLSYTDPSGYCVNNDREVVGDDFADCTVEEIRALNWDVRKWWLGQLAQEAEKQGWFNNINSILDFFRDTPEFSDLDGWASTSDAVLLWAIQDGFRTFTNRQSASKSHAGELWFDFFSEKDPMLYSQKWGAAELAGTSLGVTYGDKVVGRPDGLVGATINQFKIIGDWYRNGLAGQGDPVSNFVTSVLAPNTVIGLGQNDARRGLETGECKRCVSPVWFGALYARFVAGPFSYLTSQLIGQ